MVQLKGTDLPFDDNLNKIYCDADTVNTDCKLVAHVFFPKK